MSNQKIREEFEGWIGGQEDYFGCASESLTRCDEEPDEYLCGAVHGAWMGWQASREALVIKLPTEKDFSASDDSFFILGRCHEAIEAAGVRVKS